MLPPRAVIEAFITRKARPASIERARVYRAAAVEMATHQARFECVGSHGERYRQTLAFNQDTLISATCSCPYDNGGICKHAVAALRELAAMSSGDAPRLNKAAAEKPSAKPSAKPLKNPDKDPNNRLIYPLKENGLIDFKHIQAVFARLNHWSAWRAE